MNNKPLVLTTIILLLFAIAVYADLDNSVIISVSLVNTDPDPAIAGDVVEVRLGVENRGGAPARDVQIEIVPEYPFELAVGQNTIQEIGSIIGYQGQYNENLKIIKYTLKVDKDANAGTYDLKVQYLDQTSGAMIQKSLPIEVQNRENAEIIHIDKTVLVPGEQSSLKFTINNVGGASLRDLTFYWENEDGIILPVGSDNTKYIKYIDIGESANLEYQVIADTNAQSGLYKLNLYLTYEDPITSEDKTLTSIAGMYVGGGTDFDVAYSDNTNGETSFTISNVGSNPANSVSVIIPEQRGWTATGSNSIIIGNLNKGDYTVASFKLQQSGSSGAGLRNGSRPSGGMNAGYNGQTDGVPSDMQNRTGQRFMNLSAGLLAMQIAYTDTMGQRQLVEKEVRVGGTATGPIIAGVAGGAQTGGFRGQGQGTTAQNQSFLAKYMWYIIALILIVLAVAIYKKHKSRKLMGHTGGIAGVFSRRKK